jgi:hypothetical protein
VSADGLTVYDSANNITWLADANPAASNRFTLPLCTGSGSQACVNANGSMSYTSAAAWVDAADECESGEIYGGSESTADVDVAAGSVLRIGKRDVIG